VVVWTQHLAFGSGVVHAWVGPAVLAAWLWVRARTLSDSRPTADAEEREIG
jgi:hypothetical protein